MELEMIKMVKTYDYSGYTVIIGDIIDSKKIKDRKKVQVKFKEILDQVNRVYEEDIASQFTITLGDEFQGLLKTGRNIINIISDIEFAMAPVELRFGIGIGEISTEINLKYSAEIDGSAYHRARAMVEALTDNAKQYSTKQANIMVASQADNAEIDHLINSVLSLCSVLKSRWTARQMEIISIYLESEANQYRTAEKLGIGQSSVSKALSSANYYSYKAALDTVDSFLTQIGED